MRSLPKEISKVIYLTIKIEILCWLVWFSWLDCCPVGQRDCGFDSWSGHMPWIWVLSPVRVLLGGPLIDVFLSCPRVRIKKVIINKNQKI